MKEETFKNELKKDGYSKEEQYFYELNQKLTHHPLLFAPKDSRFKERAIERWETDGGLIKKNKS